jgi:hypothetical protein
MLVGGVVSKAAANVQAAAIVSPITNRYFVGPDLKTRANLRSVFMLFHPFLSLNLESPELVIGPLGITAYLICHKKNLHEQQNCHSGTFHSAEFKNQEDSPCRQ